MLQAQLVLQEQQEHKVLQVIRDRLAQRVQLARKVLLVQRATQDPQVLRAQRELQVQQDLSVLQAQSERLDQLVLLAQQDHREHKA